jgi:hypothetical protein
MVEWQPTMEKEARVGGRDCGFSKDLTFNI